MSHGNYLTICDFTLCLKHRVTKKKYKFVLSLFLYFLYFFIFFHLITKLPTLSNVETGRAKSEGDWHSLPKQRQYLFPRQFCRLKTTRSRNQNDKESTGAEAL